MLGKKKSYQNIVWLSPRLQPNQLFFGRERFQMIYGSHHLVGDRGSLNLITSITTLATCLFADIILMQKNY